MMLKDKQDRVVLIKGGYRDHRYEMQLFARDGLEMVPVDEAVICKGDDVVPTEDQIKHWLSKAGFPNLAFNIGTNARQQTLQVNYQHEYVAPGGIWSTAPRVKVCYIEGQKVAEVTYDRLLAAVGEADEFFSGTYALIALQKGLVLYMHDVWELIGEGRTVTVESLGRGCAKEDERPRLLPGDQVKVNVRGQDVLGVIKAMKTKVTVLLQDGVKMNCIYSKVTRTDEQGHNDELALQTDPSILSNFDYVVQTGASRIFRAKLERGNFVFPMFPDTDRHGNPEQQVSREGILSCSCPVCGWRMADVHDSGQFVCCYCRLTGNVITRSEVEISLLMSRMPGKNRFAIKEARCCGNCGRFEFDVGRQGKRSTGYCQTANQCLQAHNVCDLWFPRDLSRYESNMRQHTTNLHFGVQDTRNTSRNDIKDTVYTEEDHKAEVARAEKAKVAYANALQRFLKNLKDEAAKAPLVEEMTPELTEHWKKVLDDPC